MKAEEAIDSFNYELAQKFCERALEVDPDDTMALETAGAVYLEIGDVSSATKISFSDRFYPFRWLL